MWQNERTSFSGKHYQIKGMARAAEMPASMLAPKILIGGGGKRVLSLAGRHADIVGINPKIVAGRVLPETPADLAPERVREKVGWVRDAARAAGRNPDDIEFQALVFVVAITDDPKGLREALAKGSGMSVEQVADAPLFITGSASEIRDRLMKRREETGISYVVIQGKDEASLERFAEAVVAPLAGR
jgi:alkanesulfonate monooxygenase SsuD/methylene tetrahydromethanopterin reductase-like flavin-dependent oxidoreductase (luciferase family)